MSGNYNKGKVPDAADNRVQTAPIAEKWFHRCGFLGEFEWLPSELVLRSGHLVITGDFNCHLTGPTIPQVKWFIDILDSMNLTQHVSFGTHKHGQTLDLIITRSDETIL